MQIDMLSRRCSIARCTNDLSNLTRTNITARPNIGFVGHQIITGHDTTRLIQPNLRPFDKSIVGLGADEDKCAVAV